MPAAAASATEVDSSAFDRLRAIYISDDAQLTLMTSTSISLLLSNRQDSCFRVDSINLQQLFFWLKVACRIDFKLAFLVYKCLHGLSPSYLAEELHHPAESEFWRRLRSASCHELSVPGTRLSTYGDRAFPVAAVRIWNSLPQHITSAPSLPVFRCRLKTYSSKSVCCRAWEVTLSLNFMETLIALTYLRLVSTKLYFLVTESLRYVIMCMYNVWYCEYSNYCEIVNWEDKQ